MDRKNNKLESIKQTEEKTRTLAWCHSIKIRRDGYNDWYQLHHNSQTKSIIEGNKRRVQSEEASQIRSIY